MSEKYLKEYEAGYTPKLVMEEASRCLLCHDAPCSQACPAGTDPAKFIRSVRFKNVKGAAETVRVNNILGAICARVCPTERYCQQVVLEVELISQLILAEFNVTLPTLKMLVRWKFLKQSH